MSGPKIRITIGSAAGNHDVPLPEFTRIVNSSYALLRNVAKIALGKGHDCNFLLSGLSHSSPASMDITPASETRQFAALDIANELREESGVLASGNGANLPGSSLKAWEDFLSPCIKDKISGLTIKSLDSDSIVGDIVMQTNRSMIEAVKKIRVEEKIWMEEIECQTSVTGKVELLNLHKRKYLVVFSRVEEWNPVKVYFGKHIQDEAVKCVDKYVEIFGMGKHRSGDALPYEMKMDEIQRLPDEEDIPKFSKMRGIAPNITGGKSVQEYMDDIRKEWD